ncbi:MAG: hypothetical protein ACKPKO_13755, partial [Candidatus Fonsibacter sp.]
FNGNAWRSVAAHSGNCSARRLGLSSKNPLPCEEWVTGTRHKGIERTGATSVYTQPEDMDGMAMCPAVKGIETSAAGSAGK